VKVIQECDNCKIIYDGERDICYECVKVGGTKNNWIADKYTKDAEMVKEVEKSCETCRFEKGTHCEMVMNNKRCDNNYNNWQPIEQAEEKLFDRGCETCGNWIDDEGCDKIKNCNSKNSSWIPMNKTPIVTNSQGGKQRKTGTTEEAKHYQVADIQPIEIMQMYLTKEEMIGGLKWQVIKYILRIGHKDNDREDVGKCNQYSKWLCDVMDGKTIVPGGK